MDNFKKSGAKYLLTTSFINHPTNTDIQTGYWRPINLTQPPFSFPTHLKTINEKCTEGGGKHKSLVLVGLENI
ncbi:hypothetical protein [Mongoliibacter ruber]|uniref:hypothetical protein n=1 Tax=Mongoliibacter ruber TaxID=1750599 RepID=UPI000D058155|nr:hypothetical protein [Mongoliibacter ruber]